MFEPDGVLVGEVRPSPNHGERAGGVSPDMLILHYTGFHPDYAEAWLADPGKAAMDWLCNPVSQVSSHYLVEMDGRIIQLVPEARRAWHAGVSAWKGETDINSASVGIEIVNLGHDHGLPPYPHVQIDAVIRLCKDIIQRRNVRPENVLAHSDIAPDRKGDPGEHFPWERLYSNGIGIWPDPASPSSSIGADRVLQRGQNGEEVRAFQQALLEFGYDVKVTGDYDLATEKVVRAFQRHFRQEKCDGIADAETLAALEKMQRS